MLEYYTKGYYIAYILDDNGYWGDMEYYIATDNNSVARFICHDMIHDKVIVDSNDLPVITTIGCFLDRVTDQSTVSALQKALLPYQSGKKEAKMEFIDVYKSGESLYQKELVERAQRELNRQRGKK